MNSDPQQKTSRPDYLDCLLNDPRILLGMAFDFGRQTGEKIARGEEVDPAQEGKIIDRLNDNWIKHWEHLHGKP